MQNKDNIQVICFDFDGTIAATMSFLTDLAVDVLTKHCRLEPDYARDQYIRTTGLPFAEQVRRICGGNGAAVRAAIAEFENRKKLEYFRLGPEAHAGETIAGLKQRGYTVAISTSTHEHLVLEYLAHFGLSPDLVMGLRPGFKKGRDHFVHIQNQCRIDSGAICFVADSINDYHIATSNGVAFIAKCGLFDQAAFKAVSTDIVTIIELKDLLAIF